ncbi:hypothetical protein BHM03_00043972 [Ensete ventricosum]|nr:hypothetical protein BHM03_00043972 [Ensete ventricosum]
MLRASVGDWSYYGRTCCMCLLLRCGTTPHDPKALAEPATIPDDAVRGVPAAVVACRPYLRRAGHACTRSAILALGRSLLCQVGHSCQLVGSEGPLEPFKSESPLEPVEACLPKAREVMSWYPIRAALLSIASVSQGLWSRIAAALPCWLRLSSPTPIVFLSLWPMVHISGLSLFSPGYFSSRSTVVRLSPREVAPGDSRVAEALATMRSCFDVGSPTGRRQRTLAPIKVKSRQRSKKSKSAASPCGSCVRLTTGREPTVSLSILLGRGFTLREPSSIESMTQEAVAVAKHRARELQSDIDRLRIELESSEHWRKDLKQEINTVRSSLQGARDNRARLEEEVLSLTEAATLLQSKLKAEGPKAVAAYKASWGFESGLEKMGRISYEFGY